MRSSSLSEPVFSAMRKEKKKDSNSHLVPIQRLLDHYLLILSFYDSKTSALVQEGL